MAYLAWSDGLGWAGTRLIERLLLQPGPLSMKASNLHLGLALGTKLQVILELPSVGGVDIVSSSTLLLLHLT